MATPAERHGVNLNDPRRADIRGWGPGWPMCSAQRQAVAITLSNGVRVSAHRRIAPIVRAIYEEGIRRGYSPRAGQTWGGACREIRGTQTPSNHSWWLALDTNSLANPMQATLRTDMPKWWVDIWKAHGFRWGGDYRGRKDAMHTEFMGTPAQADAIVAELLQTIPTPAPLPHHAKEGEDMMYHPSTGADSGAIFYLHNGHLVVMDEPWFHAVAAVRPGEVVEIEEGSWNRVKTLFPVVQ